MGTGGPSNRTKINWVSVPAIRQHALPQFAVPIQETWAQPLGIPVQYTDGLLDAKCAPH